MYEQNENQNVNQNVIRRPRRIFNPDIRNQGPNQDDQFVLDGRITPTRSGGEAIVFRLDLGILLLSFIVTIPADGTDSGPVYVKYAWNPLLKTKWFDPKYRPEDNSETG